MEIWCIHHVVTYGDPMAGLYAAFTIFHFHFHVALDKKTLDYMIYKFAIRICSYISMNLNSFGVYRRQLLLL